MNEYENNIIDLDNFYSLYKVEHMGEFKVDGFLLKSNIEFEEEIFNNICNFLENSKYEKFILICRSNMEPYSESYPSKKYLNKINNKFKNTIIFYQDPWPVTLPNFTNLDDYLILKFGYDEGNYIDKNFKNVYSYSQKITSKENYILLNNNETIKL